MKLIEIQDRTINPNFVVSISKIEKQVNVVERFTNAGNITEIVETGKYQFQINFLNELPIIIDDSSLDNLKQKKEDYKKLISNNS